MKPYRNHLLFGSILLLATFIVAVGVYASETVLNIQVDGGTISIASPTSLTFSGSVIVSDIDEDMEQNFNASDQYFEVIDLKGDDAGYTTTLQLSGDLVAGSDAIAAANVSFKANDTEPALIGGTANTAVVFDAGVVDYQTLATARAFIKRDTGANDGKLGKYGGQVWLNVTVPAYQSVGSYAGTMIYTLIEN